MLELTFERILILLITLAFVCAIGIPLIIQAINAIKDFFGTSILELILMESRMILI
ncbi:MAG: hypothetical protein ACTSPQ_14335 [Candidatus Helarchaeota archaeon]